MNWIITDFDYDWKQNRGQQDQQGHGFNKASENEQEYIDNKHYYNRTF